MTNEQLILVREDLLSITQRAFFFPIRITARIIAQPIQLAAWVIKKLRVYNPEKVVCPGCGFKGDSGTGGLSCRIQCTAVMDAPKLMIRHTCFRCSAEFYSKTLVPVEKWAAQQPRPQPTASA